MAIQAERPPAITPARDTSPPLPREDPAFIKGAALAWELLIFAFATLRSLVTPPFSWGGEFIDQAWILLKRASIPAAASAFGFGYGAPGLQGTSLVKPFGDINRVAAILGAAP